MYNIYIFAVGEMDILFLMTKTGCYVGKLRICQLSQLGVDEVEMNHRNILGKNFNTFFF